jgi:hypothetical protein
LSMDTPGIGSSRSPRSEPPCGKLLRF